MKDRNEQPVRQEQPLVIEINLSRGLLILLALVLVTVACPGSLAWGQKKAAASGAQDSQAAFTGMRKYYLTANPYLRGNQTLTACAPGYHMASLWEILDPSNLEYDTDLGFVRSDRGEGPPTHAYGWVRTGWDSATVTGTPGRDNCQLWSTADSGANGTNARLPREWTAGSQDMHVWDVRQEPCSYQRPVWCVED